MWTITNMVALTHYGFSLPRSLPFQFQIFAFAFGSTKEFVVQKYQLVKCKRACSSHHQLDTETAMLSRKMCLSKICQNPVGLKLHEKMRPQIQRFLWRRNFGGNSGSRKCERHTTLWHSPILGSFNFQKISILIHLFALWSNFNSFSFVLFLFLKRTT